MEPTQGTAPASANREALLFWSFVAALAGGLLVLVGPLAMAGMMAMMGPGPACCTVAMGSTRWGWMVGAAAVLSALVLVGAFEVRRARNVFAWGIVFVVAGALSFAVMGGFFLGALATIAAGVLALVASAPPRP